ncbi:hypothetical protein P3L10_029823 [Capsicum annuum]
MATLCSTFKMDFVFVALLFTAHLSPKSQIMAIRDIISPELQAMEQSLFLFPINRLSTCLLPCVSASDCSGTCSHCTLNALLIKLCT